MNRQDLAPARPIFSKATDAAASRQKEKHMSIATGSSPKSATRNTTDAILSLLRSGRGLLVIGAIVLGFGLIFKWNWLVAAGIAPLLLSVLPCVAMCALGLCMRKMSASSSDIPAKATDKSADTATHAPAPLLLAGPDASLTAPTAGDTPTKVVPITQKSCCHNPR